MTSSSSTDLTTIAAALTAIVGWMVAKPKADEGSKYKRRWSCMSDNMAQGTFPPKSKFDEAIINVVMVFDDSDRPSVDEVVDRCVKLLLQYERFASIYNRTTSTASYCGDKLDPYDLVREIPVSDCLLDSDLLKVMEGEACVPLAQAPRGTLLPWWEFVLLTNTNSSKKKDGKSAVVWRIHHGLGDGISLVKVVQEMFDNARTGKPLSEDAGAGNPNLTKKFKIRRSPLQWITQSISAAAKVVSLPIGSFDDLTAFRRGAKGNELINPTTMVYPTKQAIIPFVPTSLEFVKKLKTAASSPENGNKKVTVNDVLFTVISQAIHDFLKEENDPVLESKKEKLQCRTLLPIALPRPMTTDKSKSMRNFWCFISCDLSIGVNNVLERLWTIHENLADLKRGLVPLVSSTLSTLVMKLPRMISRDKTLQLFARHSMVLSNVPGPPEAAAFASHEVRSVHMIHMNIIPQLSFLSYGGTIYSNAIIGLEGVKEDEMTKKRRERLPLHVSNAFVMLASELKVPDVPKSILDHASQLSK